LTVHQAFELVLETPAGDEVPAERRFQCDTPEYTQKRLGIAAERHRGIQTHREQAKYKVQSDGGGDQKTDPHAKTAFDT